MRVGGFKRNPTGFSSEQEKWNDRQCNEHKESVTSSLKNHSPNQNDASRHKELKDFVSHSLFCRVQKEVTVPCWRKINLFPQYATTIYITISSQRIYCFSSLTTWNVTERTKCGDCRFFEQKKHIVDSKHHPSSPSLLCLGKASEQVFSYSYLFRKDANARRTHWIQWSSS